MGIELPLELRDLAEQVGARWPEGDEDAMRRSATAWRDTAGSIDALAGRADDTAQRALSAFDGDAARAARSHWEGFVESGSGHLPVSIEGCTAAADRLDHAAEEIGAAKVRIVRELVVLARNRDAAQQAAAAGNPRALAGLDTLVQGTSAHLAEVHDTLARSVDAGNGIRVDPDAPSPIRSLDSVTAVTDVAHSTGEAVGTTVAETPESVGATGSGATATVEGTAERVTGASDRMTGLDQAAGAADQAVMPAAPDVVGGDHSGPAAQEAVTAAPSGPVDEGTGPIPHVGGDVRRADPPPPAASVDPASDTAPQAVHQAWAAPPGAGLPAAAAAPQPSPYGQAAYGQGGNYAAPAAPAPGPAAGAARPAGPPAPGARPPAPAPGPPVAGTRPPAAPVYGSPAAPGQMPPRAAFRPGSPQPGGPVAAPHAPPPPGAPPPSDGTTQRPLRPPERSNAVLAFVLHQFPLGHMPVAASRPSLQWSTPRQDDDTACLRFPPQDHPESALVDDTDALVRARSGQARSSTDRPEPIAELPAVPGELLEGYDALGDPEHAEPAGPDSSGEPAVLSETEWEQRYLVRAGSRDMGPEYAWPAWAGYPEGCRETGRPGVLAADTVVDLVGDPSGRILSTDGTPFAWRSLPPPYRERGYRRYRVLRALPIRDAVSAAWFGQPGGGRRYRVTYPVTDLVAMGYLAELVGGGPETGEENAQALTLRIPAEQEPAEVGDDVTTPEAQ